MPITMIQLLLNLHRVGNAIQWIAWSIITFMVDFWYFWLYNTVDIWKKLQSCQDFETLSLSSGCFTFSYTFKRLLLAAILILTIRYLSNNCEEFSRCQKIGHNKFQIRAWMDCCQMFSNLQKTDHKNNVFLLFKTETLHLTMIKKLDLFFSLSSKYWKLGWVFELCHIINKKCSIHFNTLHNI